ncbi:MAG: DUF2953 domain-containing protein [Firmicutes bacterium]|nr:DUF2953 domain-containing protein [Bacillota bacterium]
MSIGQVILLVLGILLLLILLALVTKIRIYIVYDGQFFMSVRVLGIKVFSLPSKGDKPHRHKEADKLNKQIKSDNEQKKANISDVIASLGGLLESIRNLFGHIHVTKLSIDAVIGTGDAAQTAIKCGTVYALAYPALGLLGSAVNMCRPTVSAVPDYDEEREQYTVVCNLYFRVIGVLASVIPFVSQYLQNKLNKSKEGAK